MITGTLVSSLTVRVTLEIFPAASVAVTTMVLLPSASVMDLAKAPSALTVTAPWSAPLSLTVTVTGEDVASLVVPLTVSAALLVTRLSVGSVTLSAGGTVSTV